MLPPPAAAKYWDETAQGIANVLVHLKTSWYGDQGVYYSREKERLEKYVQPLQYGLAATVFLFVNFRITGSPRFQAWRRQWLARNKNASSVPEQSVPPHSYRPGYLETKREQDVKRALASMRTLTDFLVSLSVGTSGALFLLHGHADSMRRDFEEAPLVAGRSLVADQMCLPMMAVEDEHSNHQDHDPTDANLATFSTFVSNCRSRRKLEDQIRKMQGKRIPNAPSDHLSVVIPHPGVPRPPKTLG